MRIIVIVSSIVGAIAVSILFFFAVIFAMAASANPSRLVTSGIFFIIGIVVIAVVAGIYYVTRKPKTVIHQVEVSGQMKAAKINCPNCSAPIDANQIKIVSGVPYVTCPYCGNTFEVTEEPKW